MEAAAGRLNGFLNRWRREIAAVTTLSAVLSVADLIKRRTGESGGETRIEEKELLALDPEASPERIQLIIDTLPEGFVEGEVLSIGFTDEKFELHESYGPELQESEGAGTAAGGTRAERTVITFWKGMKESSSERIWNGTFLHEVAHANDWDNDRQMEPAERAELKANVAARVLADDRYRSAYVEAISNPDKAKEIEIKAKEYWAEIVEEYLKGAPLPVPDEALVREFIAGQDPAFDRDAALLKRKHVVDAMVYEEVAKEVAAESDEGIADGLAWVEARAGKAGLEELEAAAQRQGRRELVDALRTHAAQDRRLFVEAQLEYLHAREELLGARTEPLYPEHARNALNRLKFASDRLARAKEIATPGGQEAMEAIERIVDEHDLVLGRNRGARLELGETGELFPGSMVSDENEWIYDAVDWELGPSEYDILGPEMMLREFEAEIDEPVIAAQQEAEGEDAEEEEHP